MRERAKLSEQTPTDRERKTEVYVKDSVCQGRMCENSVEKDEQKKRLK